MLALIATALLALPPAKMPPHPALGEWSRPLASVWEAPALEFRHNMPRAWMEEDSNPLRPISMRTWGYLQASSAPVLTITSSAPTNLVISCGKGSITISFKDGSVKFDNCDPDEAARQFWFKVAAAYPYFKSAILAGAKP